MISYLDSEKCILRWSKLEELHTTGRALWGVHIRLFKTHIPNDKYTVNIVGFCKHKYVTALSEYILASSPGHSQILSCTREGKSGSGLGMRLNIYSFSKQWLWTCKPLGTGLCTRKYGHTRNLLRDSNVFKGEYSMFIRRDQTSVTQGIIISGVSFTITSFLRLWESIYSKLNPVPGGAADPSQTWKTHSPEGRKEYLGSHRIIMVVTMVTRYHGGTCVQIK